MSENDSPQDPFAAFESDRTIIKPSGSAARRTSGATPPPPAPGAMPAPPPASPGSWGARPADTGGSDLPDYASLNPLVQAAAPLLTAAPRLRAMIRHPNPQALRASLTDSVQRFEAAARAKNLPNEQIVAARYILCTFIDESASSTPWGGSGAWSSQSLLVQFHNEGWGGEKIFQLLTRLAENPAQNRNLLELMYVVLSLGFEGRYRVLDNGRAQLDSVRERLAQMLRQVAGPAETTLSSQWQGQPDGAARLRDGIPVWAVAVAASVLLLVVFILFSFTLNAQTDATFNALQGMDAKMAAAPAAPPPVQAAPVPPRLAQLLKSDIDAGLVAVKDLADRSIVTTLHSDTLFDRGSADVSSGSGPLFDRIAQALKQVPGKVLVTGHTDNQPIRSLRFPSNWHLSKERALSVRNLLATTVAADRITAEGRADSESIADNATPEGRARNRRVEITLFVAASN